MRCARVFLLLLAGVVLTAGAASAQTIQQINFQRLNFDYEGQVPISLANWARCTVVYNPGTETHFLNVAWQLPAILPRPVSMLFFPVIMRYCNALPR